MSSNDVKIAGSQVFIDFLMCVLSSLTHPGTTSPAPPAGQGVQCQQTGSLRCPLGLGCGSRCTWQRSPQHGSARGVRLRSRRLACTPLATPSTPVTQVMAPKIKLPARKPQAQSFGMLVKASPKIFFNPQISNPKYLDLFPNYCDK